MKAKIFAKLKQEYSALGLGDEVLMALAESLAATGLVSDDNIDAVVSYQRSHLESLQKHNDKRVTDALEKERKKAAEEAKKKAEEEAAKAEAERKAKEEEERLKGANPDERFADFERRLKEMSEASEKRQKEYADKLKEMSESKTALEERIKTLSEENAAAKIAQEKAARQAKILSMAKELGVPQWRIDEGFVIADDADDAAIKNVLSNVANNVKTNLLPGNKGFNVLGGGEPTKEEVSELAASLVK